MTETNAPAIASLVERLRAINAGLSDFPWSKAGLQAGIRHIVRNTEVMEDARDSNDEQDLNLPGKYDGDQLADLRNSLPEIIAEITRLEAALAERTEACAWLATEAGATANMLQNDNFRHDENIAVRDAMYRVAAAIRSLQEQKQP